MHAGVFFGAYNKGGIKVKKIGVIFFTGILMMGITGCGMTAQPSGSVLAGSSLAADEMGLQDDADMSIVLCKVTKRTDKWLYIKSMDGDVYRVPRPTDETYEADDWVYLHYDGRAKDDDDVYELIYYTLEKANVKAISMQ